MCERNLYASCPFVRACRCKMQAPSCWEGVPQACLNPPPCRESRGIGHDWPGLNGQLQTSNNVLGCQQNCCPTRAASCQNPSEDVKGQATLYVEKLTEPLTVILWKLWLGSPAASSYCTERLSTWQNNALPSHVTPRC